ncbi:hypothetical protein J5X84_03565 [Streptosporangiaceae bacterium NEAU-GS5]|nr:hypothetical protein [Streptosporangiaceae bacterium NEAU-GS5]
MHKRRLVITAIITGIGGAVVGASLVLLITVFHGPADASAGLRPVAMASSTAPVSSPSPAATPQRPAQCLPAQEAQGPRFVDGLKWAAALLFGVAVLGFLGSLTIRTAIAAVTGVVAAGLTITWIVFFFSAIISGFAAELSALVANLAFAPVVLAFYAYALGMALGPGSRG